jgi:hypothetical protein
LPPNLSAFPLFRLSEYPTLNEPARTTDAHRTVGHAWHTG